LLIEKPLRSTRGGFLLIQDLEQIVIHPAAVIADRDVGDVFKGAESPDLGALRFTATLR